MTKDTTSKPITAISETAARLSVGAARLSLAGAATFLALLTLLHFIKPEFDPSWNMISEYEIGQYGWVMQLAFLCVALSCVSLVVAIRSQAQTMGGWIGLALLLVAAIGMTIAAIGVTDPITTPKEEMTAHGNLHALGFMLGVPSLTIAAVLVSLSLGRNPAWSPARRALLWTAHLPWVSLLAMIATLLVLLPRNGGKFGPSVVIGWPNRLYMVACCAWLMTVAWSTLQVFRQKA